MKATRVAFLWSCVLLLGGCVSLDEHNKALAELEGTRKASAKTTAEFESYKRQAADELDAVKKKAAQDLAVLREEKNKLTGDLQAAQASTAEAQKALETAAKSLASEQESRHEIENQGKKLQQALAEANAHLAASTKEKEQLTAALTEAHDQGKELATKLATEQLKVSILREDKQRLLSGTTTAQAEVARMQAMLQQVEVEKAKLEQERIAKEAEIQRLSKTQEDLTKSLEAEIAKGDIRIKQVRDQLTINMVDRVLFESGQGQVKPAGLKVLKQVADIIKTVTDKQVRIEGHTDNVPIGEKLRDRFSTNWELSTARATSVVRYLIEEGGVDRALLSAVGYADTRPVAGNDTEEGRKANRRIEITLYPKDLSEITNQMTKP
jgi:chemotaxis protein MotB